MKERVHVKLADVSSEGNQEPAFQFGDSNCDRSKPIAFSDLVLPTGPGNPLERCMLDIPCILIEDFSNLAGIFYILRPSCSIVIRFLDTGFDALEIWINLDSALQASSRFKRVQPITFRWPHHVYCGGLSCFEEKDFLLRRTFHVEGSTIRVASEVARGELFVYMDFATNKKFALRYHFGHLNEKNVVVKRTDAENGWVMYQSDSCTRVISTSLNCFTLVNRCWGVSNGHTNEDLAPDVKNLTEQVDFATVFTHRAGFLVVHKKVEESCWLSFDSLDGDTNVTEELNHTSIRAVLVAEAEQVLFFFEL